MFFKKIRVRVTKFFFLASPLHVDCSVHWRKLNIPIAVLVCSGAAVYPVGWDNREVRESCGNVSNVYDLGTCELSWSVYLLGSAVGLLLLCFGLSFCSSRVKPGSFRI